MSSVVSKRPNRSLARTFCLAMTLVMLNACGGSDSTPAVSVATLAPMIDSFGTQVPEGSFGGGDAGASGGDGTAGDGAPLANAPIRITDLAGRSVTTKTDTQGYYRVRIDGLTPPFIASVTRPDGTIWFSPSSDPVKVRGFITINISGLTDKIVSDVAISAGLIGADRLTPILLAANLAAVETAKRKLASDLATQILQAGLNPATFDPVRVPFRADKTGYDAVLDNVDVSKLSGGATLVNPLYSIEGTISGLGNGSGLVLTNGSDSLNIPSGSSTFKFTNLQSPGVAYRVVVATQPSGASCAVNNGIGNVPTASVTNIAIVCSAQTFTLGGSVSGRGSLGTLTLSAGAQTVSVPVGATSFVFPTTLPQGGAYSVSVQSQPAGLTCSVSNNAGVVAAANVTGVALVCSAITNTLGGTISGLVANGLILASGGQSLPVNSGQTGFTFAAPVASGSNYAVSVQTNPVGYTCTPSNNTGVMSNSPVNSVSVSCSINSFTLGGTVAGLSSSGLVLTSGAQTLAVSSGSSSFTFGSPLAFGAAFNVSVQTQPSGLTCTVNNGSGVMLNAANTSVAINCNTSTFTLGGAISGLSSSGLVLSAGGQLLAVSSGATNFTMASPFAFGSGYTVAVQTQPSSNTCSVSSATGTVTSAVTSVIVNCSLPSFSIGGSVTGFTAGTGLVLAAGGQTVNIASAAVPYTFPIALNLGTTYNVTVQTQPVGYSCSVANSAGTVGSAAVTNINVTCTVVGPAVSTIAGPLAMTISGLTSGPDGSIYWTHSRSHSVYKRDPAGVITLIGGSAVSSFLPGGYADGPAASARFTNPKGIVMDSAGNLFVADSGNAVIRKMTPGQVWSTFAGTIGSVGFADGSRSPGNTTPVGTFTAPGSLAIDSNNTLYIASSGFCSCIRVIPSTGDQVSTVTTDLPLNVNVTEVATSVAGFVNVIANNGFVYPITLATGVSLTGLGNGTPGIKFFDGSLTTDSLGNTWAVSASFASVWLVHTGAGSALTQAVGYGSQNTGYLDGPANLASFTIPYAITVNSLGHVLIGDGEYIRRLIP